MNTKRHKTEDKKAPFCHFALRHKKWPMQNGFQN